MKYVIVAFLIILAACQAAQEPDTVTESSNVETHDVANGFLAKPAAEGTYPGIIMIHEWWGLNENIKDMARQLADEGYVVYAVDLYNGEVANDAARARELSGSVRENPDEAISTMREAVTYLREEENVANLGSLGWCFGGGQSLQLSLNEDVDATVIYYGSLVTEPEQLEQLDGPVLGIFGAEDTSIPESTVYDFENTLNNLSIENDVYVYPGVGHAFANPSGDNYAPDETTDAWEKTVNFLNENLKENSAPDVTLSIQGANFTFIMDGAVNPDIRVKQGDRVRVEFETTDQYMHDWVVAEFDAATEQVREGNVTSVEFVADEKGEFEYFCSVGNHYERGMKGRFIVE